jgi:APA family basic amino acid/polyamine antiporter
VIVLLFALAFPTVAMGIAPWQEIAARQGDPVAHLASKLPYVGFLAGPLAAILAATIVLISANTGVMGCSRLAYSMAGMGLIGSGLSYVHPKFRTPVRAIIIFSAVAAVEALVGFLTGEKALETIANMYAFGAMLAYLLASVAFLSLRAKEPHVPRPYRVPLDIRLGNCEINVFGIASMLGTFGMLIIVLWTHAFARIMGPLWILGSIAYYLWYRRRTGRPLFGSLQRNWDQEQLEILADTGEHELYERFKIEVERRKRAANGASAVRDNGTAGK